MMDRRQFLQITTGATAATLVSKSGLFAQELEVREKIELKAWSAKGSPLPQKVMNVIYFLGLNDEPLPNLARTALDGRLLATPPALPFAIALNLSVLGFGNVTLYADNQGKGYRPQDFPLNLNLACAETRLYRVKEAIALWQRQGYQPSSSLLGQLDRATLKYQRAVNADNTVQMAAWANESLRDSLWAGESAVFEQAQQQITRQNVRPDFLFGCNFFGHSNESEAYDRRFKARFKFATVPFYWRSFEPIQGQPSFDRVERDVTWLNQAGIIPKGHPLVWFHEAGVPEWIQDKSYGEILDLSRQRVLEITRHFGDRIPYYDIINEAHDIDWANTLNFSQDQMLELTQMAAETSAVGSPNVKRIINTCCNWAQYVARSPEEKPLTSAYQYLNRCIQADIPFEFIGVQLYYPNQDMFEINRLLERLSTLGKPIHITELGVSSSTEPDETSIFKTPPGLWHQPWSETVQADWVEQFYTLCYSKSFIHAITWWDLADDGFWPHGGLLREDMTPKESYLRLQKFQETLDR